MKEPFYYFNEKIINKKTMSFNEFCNKNYKINVCAIHGEFGDYEIIKKCIDVVLHECSRSELSVDNGNGQFRYETIISPSYKLAFNTLRDLKIIIECDNE